MVSMLMCWRVQGSSFLKKESCHWMSVGVCGMSSIEIFQLVTGLGNWLSIWLDL